MIIGRALHFLNTSFISLQVYSPLRTKFIIKKKKNLMIQVKHRLLMEQRRMVARAETLRQLHPCVTWPCVA